MIQIQISAKRIEQLLPVFKKEVAKNPDGFINIHFESATKDECFPGAFWSEEVSRDSEKLVSS